MGFQEHVERIVGEVVGEFPAHDGIYAVTFRIDSVEQDPRFPYVAVGYTTEADAAEQAALASDSWEARWSYASFPETGLEGVRDVGRAPAAADAHRREAESRGLWYEDDDEPDDRDELLVEWFYEVCVGAARQLHESGLILAVLGRPVPVILYDMFDPDAMFGLTSDANPAELIAEFMSEDPR
ncbi:MULTISPECIES: hypothetical protein [unclassified Streptomyces]|uniref:hypothetical protein n=1 Tax=unclassified Streptomyces TaxID=2593676 RepID=UPI002E1680B4|nr:MULTISPECIES: hypothetical protein [unclassified Streptomyces]WSQ89293.1 hypothetical protein OG722_35290 [Streptomyces sp. NBC_01212]WSR04700.1 hypothetical protein OG265_01210 [Streptomyces sp. NBC_01208]